MKALRLVYSYSFYVCLVLVLPLYSLWRQFYMGMSVLYVLMAITWLTMLGFYWRDLVRLQYWIGAVIVLGMLEKALFLAEFEHLNVTGESGALKPLPSPLSTVPYRATSATSALSSSRTIDTVYLSVRLFQTIYSNLFEFCVVQCNVNCELYSCVV